MHEKSKKLFSIAQSTEIMNNYSKSTEAPGKNLVSVPEPSIRGTEKCPGIEHQNRDIQSLEVER